MAFAQLPYFHAGYSLAAFRFRGMHQQRTSYCYTSPIKPFEVPCSLRGIANHPIKIDVVVMKTTFPPYDTVAFLFRSKQRIAAILPPVIVSHLTAIANYCKYAQHTNA